MLSLHQLSIAMYLHSEREHLEGQSQHNPKLRKSRKRVIMVPRDRFSKPSTHGTYVMIDHIANSASYRFCKLSDIASSS